MLQSNNFITLSYGNVVSRVFLFAEKRPWPIIPILAQGRFCTDLTTPGLHCRELEPIISILAQGRFRADIVTFRTHCHNLGPVFPSKALSLRQHMVNLS